MRRVRNMTRIPTATNTVVVNFEQLASCIRNEAIDVILPRYHILGGLRQTWKNSVVCENSGRCCCTQLGRTRYSACDDAASWSYCSRISPFAADAHYHHITDDIIKGGKCST